MRSQMSSKESIRTVCKCWMQRARDPRNPSCLERATHTAACHGQQTAFGCAGDPSRASHTATMWDVRRFGLSVSLVAAQPVVHP
jgi:hypothetical protein